jgi:putative transposase
MNKSSFYYQSKPDDDCLIKEIKTIAFKHVYYGYRRIYITLRKSGVIINIKKVYRIYKCLSLQKQTKKPRIKKNHFQTPPHLLKSPDTVNSVWAMDFCFRHLETGRRIKIFTLEDLYSRKALMVYPDYSINGNMVKMLLSFAFERFGKPKHIRSDNGGEFLADVVSAFLSYERVNQEFIPKGAPYYNGHNERFNGTLKRECLKLNIYSSLPEITASIDNFLEFYNHKRPHQALAYKSPEEIFSSPLPV